MRETQLREMREGADMEWVSQAHGATYAAEFGWDRSFEALVAEIVENHRPGPRERGWIAWRSGRRVGSVLCMPDGTGGGDIARLRALLVVPEARGAGVGRALVRRCVTFAAGAGYRRLRLWTVDSLVAARRLYDEAGFVLVSSQPAEAFGHRHIDQELELDLCGPPAPGS